MNKSFNFSAIAVFIFSTSILGIDDQATILLENCCKERGAYYPKSQEQFHSCIKDHCRHNTATIKTLLTSTVTSGTVLVLGPGPGNDLPIEWLIKTYDRIIFIDGYTDAIAERVNQVLGADASIAHKPVEIYRMDLTGGFYDVLVNHRKAMNDAVVKELDRYLKKETSGAYLNFLAASNLRINFRHFNPDVIISSLVTSQLALIPQQEIENMVIAATNKIRISDAQRKKLNMKFSKWLMDNTDFYLNKTYLSAIATSRAKAIYYADTQKQFLLSERQAFTNFLDHLEWRNYSLTNFAVDGWKYFDHLPVSHYFFVHHSVAGPHRKTSMRLPRCITCDDYHSALWCCSLCQNDDLYCSRECQKADWPRHKINCVGPTN